MKAEKSKWTFLVLAIFFWSDAFAAWQVSGFMMNGVRTSDQSPDIGVDSELEVEPDDVYVLLQTVQKDMRGSDASSNSASDASSSSGLVTFELLGMFFGPGGMFIGSSIDGVTSLVRSASEVGPAKGIRSLSNGFDFEKAVLNTIDELDFSANWLLYGLEQGEFSDMHGATAEQIFRVTPVDFVLFINPTYYFSRELNQVRLRFNIHVYSPYNRKTGRFRPTYRRNYEYLSQSRGNILRPFLEGEKEALIAEIEARFAGLLEQYPANRKVYNKRRISALGVLKKRDVVLPITAVNEGWPGTSFSDELAKATTQMTQMLQLDLKWIQSSEREKGQYVTFNGLSPSGKPDKFKGIVVTQLGSNTVYRDRNGNMYSVP